MNDDDGGIGNGIGLGMRNGEALHHARGALGLAGQEGIHHGIGVVSDTGLDSLVGDKAQGLVTRSEVLGDKNVLDLTKSAASALGASTAAALGASTDLATGAAF